MRQRRNRYSPSSSHILAQIVTDLGLPCSASRIKHHLDKHSDRVANLAGTAGLDWAFRQLTTAPFVVIGWPNPCKAARMTMRKAASR
jgi:hypothetical protein